MKLWRPDDGRPGRKGMYTSILFTEELFVGFRTWSIKLYIFWKNVLCIYTKFMPIPCASPEDFSSILLEIVFGQLSFTVVFSANKGKY